jgi:hypothetical protein
MWLLAVTFHSAASEPHNYLQEEHHSQVTCENQQKLFQIHILNFTPDLLNQNLCG